MKRKHVERYADTDANRMLPSGKALVDNNGPTLAWIAGPRSAFTDKTDKRAPGPQYEIWRTTFTSEEFSEPDGLWEGAQVWLNNGQATDTQDGNGLTGVVIATDQAKHQITIEIAARTVTGEEELVAFVPFLQPPAIPGKRLGNVEESAS